MRTTDRKKFWIAPALLLLATFLLQPVPEVLADVSVQDKEVIEAVEKVTPTVEKIAKKLWDLSEVSLLEIKSSAYLKDLLKKSGFTITSEKAAGETKLGILLEYDALPGLGNEAVPKKQPRKDGVTAGHGCGHNLIGAGAMGAALAIKQLMEEKGIPGTLRVYGAAAEAPGGRYHTFTDRKIYYVCSNCQFICTPDKEERKRRNKLVRDSGVIVQNQDGTLEAVTPEEAHKRMDAMDPERRAMYEGEIEPDPNGHNELIQRQKFHHKL